MTIRITVGAGRASRIAILLTCAVTPAGSGSRPVATTITPTPAPGWSLTWSDEFNGASGSAPDSARWTFDLGGSGWGNQELESYTNRLQNARQENGNLVIAAIKESFAGVDGIHRDYTSARLKSEGLFSPEYGRFETRIKIPKGQGLWPAFWMLGSDIGRVGWPNCGEIDIMENIGSEPAKNHGSMHGPRYSGAQALTAIYSLPGGQSLGDDFHVYALEWEPGAAHFYVDGVLYETQTPASLPSGAVWVYDHPFFLILNVAVGGAWPGSPDARTMFPQSMLVDYVRVYSRR